MPKTRQKENISEMIRVSSLPRSSPDINTLDFAICGVLENKPNGTIGLLKIVFEEGLKNTGIIYWKACKSFRKHGNTVINENDGHTENFYSFPPTFLFCWLFVIKANLFFFMIESFIII